MGAYVVLPESARDRRTLLDKLSALSLRLQWSGPLTLVADAHNAAAKFAGSLLAGGLRHGVCFNVGTALEFDRYTEIVPSNGAPKAGQDAALARNLKNEIHEGIWMKTGGTWSTSQPPFAER